MTVLVIDDQREVVRGLLAGIHWEDIGASCSRGVCSAAEAREVFRTQEVDLMLCDIEMPGESGLQLYDWVREHYPETKCIFLTSHMKFDYAVRALQMESVDYILQPARYGDVEKSVARALEGIRERRVRNRLLALARDSVPERSEMRRERRGEDGDGAPLAPASAAAPLTPPQRDPGDVRAGVMPLEAARGQGEEETIVDRLKTYIAQNVEKELSRNELAEYLHINPDYMSRLFKREMGQSLKKYIIEAKIGQARALMLNTPLPVAIIASRLGFGNFSYFSQVYRKITGEAPLDSRKKQKRRD